MSSLKISGFCLTTNSLKFNYPFIESIRSFLPVVDELVVIDGGSTDGTIEAIKDIGDSKIRIVCDEDTKWEEDWFYSRMSHNFNRGYEECTGDAVFKFDVDFILDEECVGIVNKKYNFREDCELKAKRGKCILQYNRLNYILVDRHYIKKQTPFLVFRDNCKQRGLNVKWGVDLVSHGWGNIPIIYKLTENGINFGQKFTKSEIDDSITTIHNYNYTFQNIETVKELRYRNLKATIKQKNLEYKWIKISKMKDLGENVERDGIPDFLKEEILGKFARPQTAVPLEKHPQIIREKIKAMTPDMLGYGAFGWLEDKFGIKKASYF